METNQILVGTTHWECTRNTFYKVIKVMNGYATIKELKKIKVKYEPFAGTLGSGEEIPSEEFSDKKEIRKKIRYNNIDNSPYIRISNYERAYEWNGKPQEYDYTNI